MPQNCTLHIVAALCLELLKTSPSDNWVGKTIDLSSAYRNSGVSPGFRWVSFIVVNDPAEKWAKIFSMKALPFGASRSVYGFLRAQSVVAWMCQHEVPMEQLL